ncbi:hypothetical protein DV451_004586 [Geotrichum candidum]|uniref:Methionine aminopeptidase 2 n=1 Tax=Geotrichum candidum TaxID=1173061 RepID=A0A9P5KS66_GEOCN|nr:hypothetical protein DV451_004586 [Geotrichum candidum]KAI9213557.1 hypothetical protein DS838_001580 [Geotrichum bryndzae]KAF5108877.1 hypothetical protein DV453_002046 [Geotrichum candidum]KAF5116282.1 hypothetical protein DV454_001766 [Geotrichum candidum]KAF5118413.1 hypothetical protein DV452_002049 [Geotrichum candidum]
MTEAELEGELAVPAEGGANGTDATTPKKKKKNNKKKKKKNGPPGGPLSDKFPDGIYPEGQFMPYKTTTDTKDTDGVDDNLKRTTDAEVRANAREAQLDALNDLRHASEVHRTVRRYARSMIKPGMLMWDIAENIENATRTLTGNRPPHEAGVGFPTGLSINHCAAHYTPNKGDTTVLGVDDVLKVDIGVHVNGYITDSAFTLTFDNPDGESKYATLLKAVQAATETGIREAGVDVRLGEIGAAIQEVMESYELELDGKTYPIKPIRNLSGHNIERYRIHGGKSVPIVKTPDQTKMEEGETFAIETFGSTGRGVVRNEGECSHYGRIPTTQHVPLRVNSAKALFATIDKTFGTLPFSRRQLDHLGEEKYLLALNTLVRAEAVRAYPPLVDIEGSYTAQYEHTIVIKGTGKEVVSRGDDY